MRLREGATEFSFADKIWNRACETNQGPGTAGYEGDLALRALLSLHGLTMNGGVFHPFSVLSHGEMEESLRAYRYYGLDAVADLFIRARFLIETSPQLDSFEKEVDEEYTVHVPDDETLVRLFQRHLAAHPELYAPQ